MREDVMEGFRKIWKVMKDQRRGGECELETPAHTSESAKANEEMRAHWKVRMEHKEHQEES